MNRNHVFDSHGPDVRVRGTAQQLFENISSLAVIPQAAETAWQRKVTSSMPNITSVS